MTIWRTLLRVARKELMDHLRDRRSVALALFAALFGPLLIGLLFSLLARWHRGDSPIELPIAGRANAPGLVAFI